MKTVKYRKRCFDRIEGITVNNKELVAEVEHLRRQLEAADQKRAELEAQNQNLQEGNSRVTAECGRLKEDNEKLARS